MARQRLITLLTLTVAIVLAMFSEYNIDCLIILSIDLKSLIFVRH
jgi:hypothetical protein